MAYTDRQLEAYFQRIGFQGKVSPTGETLSALQKAHMEHIPYENGDIVHGIPLDLTEEGLFHKMVERNRGGYCFEQNGLLYFVLTSLGFSVTQYCGRFLLGSTGIPDRRHRVLRVQAEDGVFICDAGVYGEAPRIALPFAEGGTTTDGLCHYRWARDHFYGWIQEQKEEGKDWKQTYAFTQEPWLSMDFVQPSFFCEKHPESLFTAYYKIGLYDGPASLTLLDHTFTRYEKGAVVERREILHSQLPTVLRETFSLEF